MKSKKFEVLSRVFYTVILALALGLPNMAFASPVPDTGQTKCYNNTVEIPCPQAGETFYGQDAQYGSNLQSFTDLGNGIVRDNVTGLEWQKATAPGFGSGSYPRYYTWQQAIDYCAGLNLGGKDDWRLPTIKELSTLVDRSILSPGPAISSPFFYVTWAYYYWTSTTSARFTDSAWIVDFSKGDISGFGMTLPCYVRAVRSGQSNNNFVDNNDGTISDTDTGLMWQQATITGYYSWQQALSYCENLSLAGHDDWRLPNINELQSIVDYGRSIPSIDTTYFPITEASMYWSATTYANSISSAWYVDFYDGNVSYGWGKGSSTHVRAVRGGQISGDTSTTTSIESSTTTTSTDSSSTTTMESTSSSTMTSVISSTTTLTPVATTTTTTIFSGSTTTISGSTTISPTTTTVPVTTTTVPAGGSLEAEFTGCEAKDTAPAYIQFYDISTGNPVAWEWTFGDGGTSYEQNPLHTYSAKGKYTVMLKVTDSTGASDTVIKANCVMVGSCVVDANFKASPTSGTGKLTVQFTDLSTGPVTAWQWSFGDGGSSEDKNPVHDYNAPGVYTVSLIVEGGGCRVTDIQANLITVNQGQPCSILQSIQGRIGAEEQAAILRNFRDNRLAGNFKGGLLIGLYYFNSVEIVKIFERNPEIKKEFGDIVEEFTPRIEHSLMAGQTVLTKAELERIEAVLQALTEEGGPVLRASIQYVRQQLTTPAFLQQYGITIID